MVRSDDILETETGGSLGEQDVLGHEGGVTVGVGVVGTWDSRDRRFAPHRGGFAEFHWTSFDASLGSDYAFGVLSIDMRRYLHAGERGVVATRAYIEAATGEAPFQHLPKLGGSRLMRGYREGRFRDDLLGVIEAEYRFPVARRFGCVVFSSLGDVAGGLDDIQPVRRLERALGAGLRYRLNAAGVNIRADWARGREGGALYLGLGEAF